MRERRPQPRGAGLATVGGRVLLKDARRSPRRKSGTGAGRRLESATINRRGYDLSPPKDSNFHFIASFFFFPTLLQVHVQQLTSHGCNCQDM